ncbi:MAG: 3'-5' exonuclease [bacterium]|nr:3'-5' exonuclease [bacterium]
MTIPKFKDTPLEELDLVFFDCEFTGLEILKHELIEIGFVKAKAKTLEFIEEGDIKILPQHIETADPHSLQLNGYNEEEWKNEGVGKKEGLEEFLRHTENCMLIGHNVNADRMFVQKALEEVGLKPNFHYKSLDTLSLGWAKLKDKGNFKTFSLLNELAPHFEVDTGREHRAIDDARTTYQVFKKLIDK